MESREENRKGEAGNLERPELRDGPAVSRNADCFAVFDPLDNLAAVVAELSD